MPGDRMRVDIWLWRARFFKTRSLASDAIASSGARAERDGQVRRIEKASATIAAGDLLSFTCPSGARVVRVLVLPQRRGPAIEAVACYETLSGAA